MPALDKMSLEELQGLANKLTERIACDPKHSRMEQRELDDVNKWIAERKKVPARNPGQPF